MKKETIKKLLMINVSMFPQFYTKLTDVEMGLQINVWFNLFEDQDDEIIATAFRQALKKAQYPVKPADVTAILDAQRQATMPTFDELWNCACNTAKEISRYYSRERGWENEYGAEKTGYQKACEFYDLMPEILKEWKDGASVLLYWWYGITSDNEQFIRREFERNIQERMARREILGIGYNEKFKPIFDNQSGLLKDIPSVRQIKGGQNGTN